MTWRPFEMEWSLPPVIREVLPDIPVSISSKIRVSISSASPVTHLMASMILESSPPLAMEDKGLGASPGLRDILKSMVSNPSDVR